MRLGGVKCYLIKANYKFPVAEIDKMPSMWKICSTRKCTACHLTSHYHLSPSSPRCIPPHNQVKVTCCVYNNAISKITVWLIWCIFFSQETLLSARERFQKIKGKLSLKANHATVLDFELYPLSKAKPFAQNWSAWHVSEGICNLDF